MIKQTATLGGNASDIVVAKTAHGLAMFTCVSMSVPIPDEDAFAAIKAGLDSLPPNTKMVLNSGEFYATGCGPGNLELISRFFEQYPNYVDRAFLSVKGGHQPYKLFPPDSPENLRRSIDQCNSSLRGKKAIDLFQCARVDPNYPIEDTIKILKGFVDEGKFKYIGLSEVSAATVRRAAAVAPIAAVEIEVSLWSYTQETKDVISTCAELGIAVLGYSPLGRGLLTGQITKPEDLEDGDYRRNFTRFKEENMRHNLAMLDALKAIASKKGVTPAQLSIAWVSARGPHVIPLPGSSNIKRTLENLEGGDVELSAEELAEINTAMDAHEVKGGRYVDDVPSTVLGLWG
ncbi:aldo/keto reductase [Artomyces pyxidatus]|uniref:Aldo/keto reductase n=1 Tax=Artomyces pyxidatus TaxID=48021 RepID=A0ACB8SHR1_9AGAM|nr:aldo/keto reductase [Artomyces pyxidatus]